MPKDSELLLLSANRFFAEGVHLDHKRRRSIGHQMVWANPPESTGTAKGDHQPPASFKLTDSLTRLLEPSGWEGLPVVLVLPASELIFRRLHFPFSDSNMNNFLK